MFQTTVAAPVQARLPDDDLLEPVWRLAGDLERARVLIVAEHGLDLMCGLIRRGCLAATELRAGEKPDAGDYDVVVVTALMPPEAVIRLAHRALGANGRLIAGVGAGRASGAMVRLLRLNGFAGIRMTSLPGLVLVSASLRLVS
jgi:hypothetical protein